MRTGALLLVAVLAGTLGVVASLMVGGPGPLLKTDLGQRALQSALDASAPTPPAGMVVATRGDSVPEVPLTTIDGRAVSLPSHYRGRPMLVNFWASWCAPCIEEMPELQRYFASQGSDGVQVVGIALDEKEAVQEFLGQVAVRYPILLDIAGPSDSSVQWGNRRGVLPYTVLIDGSGRLVQQRIGPFTAGQIDAWTRAGLQQH